MPPYGPRRYATIPWCLGPLRRSGALQAASLLADALILGAPSFALVDEHHLSRVVYHDKVLEAFKKLHGKVKGLPPLPAELFFMHGMLAGILDRRLGPVRPSDSLSELSEIAKLALEAYADDELAEADPLLARQILVTLCLSFVSGQEGLCLELAIEPRRLLMEELLAAEMPIRSRSTDHQLFHDFLKRLRAELKKPGEGRPELFGELLGFLRSSQAEEGLSRRGRLIRARLKSVRVADACLEIGRALVEEDTRQAPQSIASLQTLVIDEPGEELELPPKVGPYVVIGTLGEGAMGQVFLARTPTGKQVAVKVFKPPARNQEMGLRRFGREARISMALEHKNIARALDYGIADGQAFLVLELLTGGDLQKLIASRVPLPEREVWALICDIAGALDYAWTRPKKYVHRDLKPANVMLDAQGRVRVSDFGLAAGVADGATRYTITGTVMGNPGFMAPEQFDDAKHVDIRADLWALGTIAYELISGKRAFSGETMSNIAYKVAMNPPNCWDEVEAKLSKTSVELIAGLLAKRPEDRFQSPRALLTWLGERRHEGLELAPVDAPKCELEIETAEGQRHHLFVFVTESLAIGRNDDPRVEICLRALPPDAPGAKQRTLRLAARQGRFTCDERDRYSYQEGEEASSGTTLSGAAIEPGSKLPCRGRDQLNLAGVFSLRLHPVGASLLIVREDEAKHQAYLWLRGELSLERLDAALGPAGWPPLRGQLYEQSEPKSRLAIATSRESSLRTENGTLRVIPIRSERMKRDR